MAVNYGQGAQGAAGGAMMGAQFGPYGAAAGAGIGGLLGLLSGGDAKNKISNMDKDQKKLYQQQIKELLDGGQLNDAYKTAFTQLQKFLDPSPEAMQAFTDPIMREFEEQTIPNLAERFAGAGGNANSGALSSSGFGQALGAAGAGLQENLASLKSQLMMKAAEGVMGQYNTQSGQSMAAKPFGYQKPEEGFGTGLLASYAQQGFPGMGKIPGAFGYGSAAKAGGGI